jgi:deoxycytidine triphosphate deaminase
MIHLGSSNSSSSLSTFQPEDVQPNAIDLRVDQIRRIDDNVFTISEDGKIHRGSAPIATEKDGYWRLENGTYEVIMEGEVTIGPDEAGWVITRSSLNRNGVFLTSGLYDSGYSGVMAGALHVHCGTARIKKGTRIGQFLLFKAESLNQYSGSYGSGSEHDKKYKEQGELFNGN